MAKKADPPITYSNWSSWHAARLTVRDSDGTVIQELVATGNTKVEARRAVLYKAISLRIALEGMKL